MRNKILAIVAAIMMVFGGGTYTGYRLHDLTANDYSTSKDQFYSKTVFTPFEDGLAEYLKFLDGTQHKLRIATYVLTEDSITDKLIELKKTRGVDVKVLLDRSQSVARSGKYVQEQVARLRAAGIEVVIGTSEKKGQIMHLKYTVRDDAWVEDGSWNYSASASWQNNNLDFTHDPARAQRFTDNWDRMYRFVITQDQTPWDKTD